MNMRAEQALRAARGVAMQWERVAAVWNAYKSFWDTGTSRPIDAQDLYVLGGEPADEARAFLRQGGTQADAIKETFKGGAFPDESDQLRIMIAALGESATVELWRQSRNSRPAAARRKLVEELLEALLDELGREHTRALVPPIWANATLEEERQAILGRLVGADALTDGLLRQLGDQARQLLPLVEKHGWRRRQDLPTAALPLPAVVSVAASGRLGQLLDPLRLPVDLRDAGFSSAESKLFASRPLVHPDVGLLLRRALGQKTLNYQEWERSVLAVEMTLPNGAAAAPELCITVLELLHLRMILEAPSLSPALENPEHHLVPEALLYLLGRDSVSYSPELRLLDAADRRWRARWAESMAEAVSVLFLERALSLIPSTVSRIPEEKQETPDFRAQTAGGEHIVFESKGGTAWKTHLSQRKKALSQLLKDPAKGQPPTPPSWAGHGRAFACCLYAGRLGESRSSLLYAADPPFRFQHHFVRGWKAEAQRSHYAAVAEVAGLTGLANRLVRGETSQGSDQLEGDVFAFPGSGENTGQLRFRGVFSSLETEARRLRHPNPSAFKHLRMFAGIPETLYRQLQSSGLSDFPLQLEEQGAPSLPSGSGLVPGTDGSVRGVYSQRPDGAFLAFAADSGKG